MKPTDWSALQSAPEWMDLFARNKASFTFSDSEPPLRGELFSTHQMEQHGLALAQSHVVGTRHTPDRLLARLSDNEALLARSCALLIESMQQHRQIAPADEWLLDNFYLIEEQIRLAKRHLPKGYSRSLPQLAHGPSKGLPRVYDIALETISHSDARIDAAAIRNVAAAYQTVEPLQLGELWAIPIMLRLALIENLRRVAIRLANANMHRGLADSWASAMRQAAQEDPTSLILVIADMARSDPPTDGAFVAELARRLQGHGPALALPLTWFEQRLAQSGQTIEQMVVAENRQQAADQVSMSNSIGSLRTLSTTNWNEFVEAISVVEGILRTDPAGVYARMDFPTRDQYRHSIERLAKRSRRKETEIAALAVELAARPLGQAPPGHRRAHVGFYLIGPGRDELAALAHARPAFWRRSGNGAPKVALPAYIGAILLATAAVGGLLIYRASLAALPLWLLMAVGLLSLVAASQLAVALVNWTLTLLAHPQRLPRMDYSSVIPDESRCLVAIPTMLIRPQDADDLAESLEIRYLANPQENLSFCLLTDFADAPGEHQPQDEAMLRRACDNIRALNDKYGKQRSPPFFLLHRPRRWNAQEKAWIGHERKRGKLGDLNALLRGGGLAAFSCTEGDLALLAGVKYVITLDTDTELPRETASKLVGTLAHPLNQACFDAAKGRVTAGYGILQPRVAVNLTDLNASAYARLYGGDPGIDPYTNTVSDVYQDIFKEGSFVGKGIYDVDAFEAALKGSIPENRVLSHDLLEGCYARSGLLSDVQLYEGHPARYAADVSRRHRWIRGDWQLLGWLLGRVPDAAGATRSPPLTALARWKIFDNLRRSLVPTSLTLLLALGWTQLGAPGFWTAACLTILLLPPVLVTLRDLFHKSGDILFSQHLAACSASARLHFGQAAFALTVLAHEMVYSLDAIVRTLYRLAVSRRRLLEWRPSSITNSDAGTSLGAAYLSMGLTPLLAVALACYLLLTESPAVPVALPILVLWGLMPLITWRLSRPVPPPKTTLSASQEIFLRKLARRTWAFFDTQSQASDHWLIPDNIQERPTLAVAHRTSPTNMGLALLANLTAYDFGYLQGTGLIARTQATLDTMASLDRYLGHFYNWYDTETLRPLHPLYISTVDSGNLAGHLLTLRPGLLLLGDLPILQRRTFKGIEDALAVLRDAIDSRTYTELEQLDAELNASILAGSATLPTARRTLDRLCQLATAATTHFAAPADDICLMHCQAMLAQCVAAREELTLLAPWSTTDCAPAWLADLERADPTLALPALDAIPTLHQLADYGATLRPALALRQLDPACGPAELAWLRQTDAAVALAVGRAQARQAMLERLADDLAGMAQADYGFLYDKESRLLTIGYNLSERRRDDGLYDLLASEARLTTFIAIAQGQLPQESWFALGRLLSSAAGGSVLLSWSGSMFEYLMPLLVMPSYPRTLLDQTCRAAVRAQIEYGDKRGVPWGISESAYNLYDINMNYQYRAFGVPGLGLKRGLADDLVVAPYASMLALLVAPDEACRNLQRLARGGLQGRFGLYEAVDYTARRLPPGKSNAIVYSYMVHHQGMGLLAVAHALLGDTMQRRFLTDPAFQATVLLLQERVPRASAAYAKPAELSVIRSTSPAQPEPSVRVLDTADTPVPEVQLLSNGRYHVMVTNSGAGSSRWNDQSVTRWREDGTCDNWGTFCYLRDMDSGEFWSTTHQPTLKRPERYEVVFSEGRAEFRRSDRQLDTHTQIVVSPEDDIELRRCLLTNRSRSRRRIEITCYAEVVIAPAVAEVLHPAFSNLFVQTEILPAERAILCTRRARHPDEHPPSMFQLLTIHGANPGHVSYETDRARFIGRGRSLVSPQAMIDDAPLSGSQGSVLDPIAAIRCEITLEPEESAVIDLVQGMANDRAACLALIDKYQDRHLTDRALDLAWTHAQVIMRQLNATEADAQLYARLANAIVYQNPILRADAGILLRNRRGQSGLWGYAISGDLPIVLLQIKDPEHFELVRQLVQAHAYWRQKGVAVDLVIWNEDTGSYRQILQDRMMGLISAGVQAHIIDRPGGIFVRPGDQISEEDRVLLQAVARVSLSDSMGTLGEQVNRLALREVAELPFLASGPVAVGVATGTALVAAPAAPAHTPLTHQNGLGGFSPAGDEYIITTDDAQRTPAPWVNVIANADFGSVISESGQAYTWCDNAHEFRLTPWTNDAVTDACGEAFYVRDEANGAFWSPCPYPAPGATPYVTRHGFGYSVFEHLEDGIESEFCIHVAQTAPVKFYALTLRNRSGRQRRLSATGYVEWVLGDLRSKASLHVATEIDAETGAVFARNTFNTDFAQYVAYFDTNSAARTLTGDRKEFIGRNGTLRAPAAMRRQRLSGRVGAGLDPCTAIQVQVVLEPGQDTTILFRLGASSTGIEPARQAVRHYRQAGSAQQERAAVREYWRHTLGVVQVETPDPAVNLMANGWLLYQTLACRLWARSGHYQSGGAFGFRDQLQDVMALAIAQPGLMRAHLLRSAAQQFVEGDVQHWWHPPSNRGVRTRCSDDYLWLPLATCHYVDVTGDLGVLDEAVGFLEGRALNPGEASNYDHPTPTGAPASLYAHCVAAITHALRFGSHGLPFIGSCDWNDGMDKVGEHGQGESVWLGFFLCTVLQRFARVALDRGDLPFAARCEHEAVQLALRLDQAGWDGEWYRRAYFDDGMALGSAQNPECQIDSISQSWAVLSGAGAPARARQAMQALDTHLIDRKNGLIKLLTPPFDTSAMNPGYIRGYVPGVRENGGQYTHAGIWAGMAYAALGDEARVADLLRLLNPIHHADTPAKAARYKVEPYVMAADIYASPDHLGRGGWTWYTGSSGLMYRYIVESVLGLRLRGDTLHFEPCLPPDWSHFKLRYQYHGTRYQVTALRAALPAHGARVELDGVPQADGRIRLRDDGQPHEVRVLLGPPLGR